MLKTRRLHHTALSVQTCLQVQYRDFSERLVIAEVVAPSTVPSSTSPAKGTLRNGTACTRAHRQLEGAARPGGPGPRRDRGRWPAARRGRLRRQTEGSEMSNVFVCSAAVRTPGAPTSAKAAEAVLPAWSRTGGASYVDTSEPEWHNAFGTAADYQVPAESCNAFSSADWTSSASDIGGGVSNFD